MIKRLFLLTILSFFLASCNETNTIPNYLTAKEIGFYHFPELPISFETESIGTTAVKNENGTLTLQDSWSNPDLRLTVLYTFSEKEPLSLDQLTINDIIKETNGERIHVKGEKGIYYQSENSINETIVFSSAGINYEVMMEHEDSKAFSKDYLINIINNYFIKEVQ